ncbi:hypothetical protein HPP92_016807 [Vanilla planifolia]|uniref:Epidermal patterning factor-like protein n=1 Tax=Vanilla planifolia TaxID=51239 RepID=A0A835UQC0_VANPL|nr:hypothetical protein HPP92_016807 [Vanilla planifolia]
MERCFALAAVLFLFIHNAECLRPTPNAFMPPRGSAAEDHDKDYVKSEEGAYEDVRIPYGSSLPDCSHACGPCSPCQRVMVSFECSVAESCPIVYKCMCKGRYYHVPSN